MSIVPVIAGLAFLCGGFMLFDDIMNEVYYIESAALVRKYEGKTELSKEAKDSYERAKNIVDRRNERIEKRNNRNTENDVAMRSFLDALASGNMNAAILVLKMNPTLKKNPVLLDIIDAVVKKDNAALEAALKAFKARSAPAGPGPS
jgi:hypothetical protein